MVRAVKGLGGYVPDIFDEVREDLRADRARALLRRYGAVGIGLMLAVLVAVGVYDWQDKRTGQTSTQTAERFIAAQESAGKQADNPGLAPPAALTGTLANIAATGPAGYRVLASLQLAALDWDAGRHDKAIAAWTFIAADTSAPKLLRDLATLTSAQHQVDTGNAQALKDQLRPLIEGGNQWRPLAEQVTALLDIRLGRAPEAKEIMKSLTTDPQAPPGVRQMAQDLLTTMGEDGTGPHG
jgi:hypothetical protein